MHGLVVYLFAGLCWFGINLTILAQKVDVADRIRKHFAKELERAPVKLALQFAVMLLIVLVTWPLWIVVSIAAKIWWPRLDDRMARNFRRTWLDREDLFKPQMPAPRCPTHNIVVPMERQACAKCAVEYDNGWCSECVREGVTFRQEPFLCDTCRPVPCPWCRLDVTFTEPADPTGPRDGTHVDPVCDGWRKCAASADPAAHMMEFLTMQRAEAHVVALTCVDCRDSVASGSPPGAVRPPALASNTVAEFERTHRGHRAHASMSDGRVVLLPPPSAEEVEP